MIYFKEGKSESQNLVCDTPFGGRINFALRSYTLPKAKVWYENRDGFHSNSKFENTIYFNESQQQIEASGVESSYRQSLNGSDKYSEVVVSNASMAYGASETQGCLARRYDRVLAEDGVGWTVYVDHFLIAQRELWATCLLFVCPEHTDYDEIDWFKINHPYIFVTQGSSGSDQATVGKLKDIVEAIPDEVLEHLKASKRLGEVVTYLFRSDIGDYQSPTTHRPVHRGTGLTAAGKARAAGLTIDSLPPQLRIELVSDSLPNPMNHLARTAEVIAVRRTDGTASRTLVVRAVGQSNKPLTYRWIINQGQCEIAANGPECTITIPMQRDFAVDGKQSNRIEVMCLAHDGTHYSCPAMVSEYITPRARLTMPNPSDPSDPSSGYVFVAMENQAVNFAKAMDVAYGANGRYAFKENVVGQFTFSNAAFGKDPINGVLKKGYAKDRTVEPQPQPPNDELEKLRAFHAEVKAAIAKLEK